MASLYRFTDCSFDIASGELRTAQGVTRLQPQAAAVLAMLLDRAGGLVTRAELKARLWPDTTVEFDDGLNFCVRQIRLALGDDADSPRFIETLPRRGYRFLPLVTTVAGDQGAPRRPLLERRWVVRGIAVAIGIALLVGVARAIPRRGRSPDARAGAVVLALVPFSVDGSDAMLVAYERRLFAGITADALAERGWRVAVDTTSAAPAARDSATTFFDRLAAATGASHVLSGSLTRHGNSVRLFVRLVQMPGGGNVWADSILDAYAFSGNSRLTADRIARSVSLLIGQRRTDSLARPLP